MLTRTPAAASRTLPSQQLPWGPTAAAASFATSATVHFNRKPAPRLIPISSAGWDTLPAIIPPRRAATEASAKAGEINPLPGGTGSRQASILPTSSPWTRQVDETLRDQPRPMEKPDPHARSKIIKEMQEFIWEKLLSTTDTRPPPVTSELESTINALDPSPKPHPTAPKLRFPPMDFDITRWLSSPPPTASTTSTTTYNGPTLLLLTSTTPSLLESDFYRLARLGTHLDWAVGLSRVVQARDPTTHTPIGKYYIFFETRAAALAYEEEVRRLYGSARKGETVGKGFTLVPPTARLEMKLHLGRDIERGIWEKEKDKERRMVFCPEGEEVKAVMVWLEGGMSTVEALRGAIERDGGERRLSWRAAGEKAIRAVEAGQVVVEGEGEEREVLDVEGKEAQRPQRFSRFVVPFADENAVRRFVRHWHRREFPDFEGRDMTIMVNATVLW